MDENVSSEFPGIEIQIGPRGSMWLKIPHGSKQVFQAGGASEQNVQNAKWAIAECPIRIMSKRKMNTNTHKIYK